MDESVFGTRTTKGEWTPHRRSSFAPLFDWPTRPLGVLRWFVGLPGFIFPFNALYLAVATAAYLVATPSRQTTEEFEVVWVGALLVRNLLITAAWYGLFHLVLYSRKRQSTRFKYNERWPRESERFLLGSQTRENLLLTLGSGVPIWTAYEVLTLWLSSNGRIAFLSWSRHPVWFVAWFFFIPIWREFHFYSTHRLIHHPRLYKTVHALHHRNTNPGPWSGMSMHPLEHLVYFTAVLIHWVIPSHPIHAMYTLFHLSMAPVPGHLGFEKVELGSGSSTAALDSGGLAHYLHHKYFEVNYSDGAVPLDRWFGSFHDGSPEAHERMKHRLGQAG